MPPQGGGGGGGGGGVSGGFASRSRGERAMEKEVATKAQPPRTGPTLPSNYVTLAQLQEQRRLKLEGQRKEQGDQAAEARQRERLEEEEEEELVQLQALKVEGKWGEREEAPPPGRGRAGMVRPRRGGRSSPTQWRRKNGGEPLGGVSGATVPERRRRGGRGRAKGRGEEGEPRDGRGRSSNRTGSGCIESGAGAARSAAAVAAVGEVDPQDRSETEGREDVMPRPIDAEEGGKLQQTKRGIGASEMEVEQREGNVDLASSFTNQEGTKVTQRHFQSTVGKVGWRAKHSEPLQPANGIAYVACKLKDMSITMTGEDKVSTGEGDGGDRSRRRPTMGRRGGGYPSFRGNGAFGPWRRSRLAGDNTMWEHGSNGGNWSSAAAVGKLDSL
ncbi:hypothetical protein Taro_026520 [Colocasia esculenta]|uniref:Uncharacterized protein n=1 Tax=Colocasia esculenta TaxID=4460 RepID=A0A843VC39_COLES|nr:hypothetical protein [Colocasia esculenta]